MVPGCMMTGIAAYACSNNGFTYSKTCVKRSLPKGQLFSKTTYRLMQAKSIAECSKRSILQYFRPALSYHLSSRSLFCLFLSGRFTQVLLYRRRVPKSQSGSWFSAPSVGTS